MEPVVIEQKEHRLLAAIRPVATQAERIVGKVRVTAWGSMGAGVWLWVLIWYPFVLTPTWRIVLAGVTLLLLLLPGLVLGLFHLGIVQLMRVPGQLAKQLAEPTGQVQALREAESPEVPAPRLRKRMWGFVRLLWSLRDVVLESKALLIQSAALLRFANPFFLGAVVVSWLLGVLLLLVSGLWTLILLV